MNIIKQHSEFKLRGNKVDSNHYVDLKPNQIDSFLDASAMFMVNHWGELFKFGSTQFSKDLFSTLLIKYPDQPELVPSSSTGQQYEYRLDNLKYSYLHLDRAYFLCGNQVVPITMITGDEELKLNDHSMKPSFYWKRLLGMIAKSSTTSTPSLYVYSDIDLSTKGLRVEYVKEPKKVFHGSYDSVEFLNCQRLNNLPNPPPSLDCNQYYNLTTPQINSDLPPTYHDLQVDIAVWLATGKTENQFLNQFISQKVSSLPQ